MRLAAIALQIVIGVSGTSAMEVTYYPRQGVACEGLHYGPGTAAHVSLPCGTKLRVTTRYGSADVTIVDRMPRSRNRVLDVDTTTARKLGLIGPGHLPVQIEVLR